MPSSWMIASSGALPSGRADDGRTNTMNAHKRPIESLRQSLAAIGGPLLPATSETAVFRWLANANYELDYRGQVFLFDTYYNRKARNRPLGFSAEHVKRASVIFLGHGHFDHMSDIVPVAAQTGAPVVA